MTVLTGQHRRSNRWKLAVQVFREEKSKVGHQVSPLPNQAQDTRNSLQEAKNLKPVESVLQMQREGTIGRRLPKCYSKQWL
jgi:hypothetical protein